MSASPFYLWDLLRLCTAKLEISGGSRASGTLIGPGLLVTCSHVLPEAGGAMRVFIEGEEVTWELLRKLEPPDPDLALLRIQCADHSWVHLDASVFLRDNLYAFGHTDDMPLGDSVTGEFEGWSSTARGQDLKFKGGQIRPGMSGAPLLNLRTGSVCGIVRTTRNRGTDLGGRAVTAEAIVNLLGQLPQVAAMGIDLKMTRRWQEAAHRSGEAPKPFIFTRHIRGSLEAAEFFCGREGELATLEHFWAEQTSHILALVGVGGSGKTAITRYFLDRKGWLSSREHVDDIDRLFVWSFYDYPSTSDFLQTANDYFSHEQSFAAGTVDRLLESLRRVDSRTLIVLDGLEKMQAPGGIGGPPRGAIEDPPLRHLLLSIADGDTPSVKVIVTSRFPLTDFSARPASGYRQLLLDDLTKEAASELLNHLGVHSPTEALIRDFGRHALTIDLLGRLLSEFFNGEMRSGEVLPPLPAATGTPAVEKQANRLARVLTAYLRYLSETEVALLQRVSLFRRPVEERFLMDLVSTDRGGTFAGPLGKQADLQRDTDLRRLVTLRLVTREPARKGVSILSSHPAIRDYFYSTIGDAQELHTIVRERLVSLADRPGGAEEPAPGQMDLLEELIYQTVMLGRREEAFQIYRDRLGYLRLGWERGDHARGVSVLRMIGEGEHGSSRSSWTAERATRFGIDYALYLKNLGALDEAIDVLVSMRDDFSDASKSVHIPFEDRALILQNLSAIEILRGWLPAGEDSARRAVAFASELKDTRLLHDCRVRLATASAMQGDVASAEEEFVRAAETPLSGKGTIRDVLSLRYAWLLRRLGRTEEALQMLVAERERYRGLQYGIIVARLDIVLAETFADLGRVDEGLDALEGVFQWITTGSDQEMVIAGHIARARLARAAENPQEIEDRTHRAMRLAQKYGYVTYWVDAVLLDGWAKLLVADWRGAISRAEEALNGNDAVSDGLIPGASDARVRYQWGEWEASQLRSRALTVSSE